MMKTQVLFAVLAALVLAASSATVKSQADTKSAPVSESKAEVEGTSAETFNLIAGIISQPDILLYRGFHTRPALEAHTQVEDIVYRSADPNIKISYIQALAVGGTSNAYAIIREGGIRHQNVTIRLSSPIGSGFTFWIEIWGN